MIFSEISLHIMRFNMIYVFWYRIFEEFLSNDSKNRELHLPGSPRV